MVVFMGDEDIIIDDDEEDEELLAPDLHNSVSLVLEEDDLTGEMVTLLLLLSFFCGELAPKSRPNSSSTLSKADEVDDLWPPSLVGLVDFNLELSKLLLLTVRFLRSIKSLGLRSTRPGSGRLGRTRFGLGSSESSEVSNECGGK